MSAALEALTLGDLEALALGLETGRVALPSSVLGLRGLLSGEGAQAAVDLLGALSSAGVTPVLAASALRLVAAERRARQVERDALQLVWSGPETEGAASRDTSVVADELFQAARRSVLLSGYAVKQGKAVFRELAANLDHRPSLAVRMFLNVHRPYGDTRGDAELLRLFAEDFLAHQWPGSARPEVFYDPRALSSAPGPRACLHAKCIVIDDEHALVTSANFTEAALERNIEAGVLIHSPAFARQIVAQFETLAERGLLRRVPGIRSE